MVDSYRPGRPDRDRPPPLADRMTFTNGTGDSYRPGGQHQSEFTFESNHPAPRFPPSGPANPGSRPPARGNRGGHKRGRVDHHGSHGRNNANGYRRGAPHRKAAAPHERALLQHRDDGSPEHTYGVSDGPNRFMNVDDMSDDEEADMEESDASAGGNAAEGQPGDAKVARTQAPRADGNTVPQWSNPDPYTSLPPPSETTGVKKDVVQLIRKAKNQAAEKAVGNNAVAANDDFISFGDDDDDVESDDAPGLRIYEDDEPIRGRGNGNASKRPVEGRMNDLPYIDNMVQAPRQDTYQPHRSGGGRKRKYGGEVGIVQEWLASPRGSHPTPWAEDHGTYKHLADKPERW